MKGILRSTVNKSLEWLYWCYSNAGSRGPCPHHFQRGVGATYLLPPSIFDHCLYYCTQINYYKIWSEATTKLAQCVTESGGMLIKICLCHSVVNFHILSFFSAKLYFIKGSLYHNFIGFLLLSLPSILLSEPLGH